MTRDTATKVAKRATSTFFTWLSVGALAVAVAAVPADAKKRKPSDKPADDAIIDPNNGEPMILVVSLGHQKVDVYRGTTLVTSSQISTGMPGHATKAGVFSILEKQRFHHSNIYSGAPMPWMNRITWSGTALHAGVVPGYPASHGCIRLPFSFAPKLFQITTVGDNVVVTRERLAPKLIEHPNLFQPLPPPAAPAIVNQEQPPQRQTSNELEPAQATATALPLIFAKADIGGVTLDRTPSVEAVAPDQHAATNTEETGSLGHGGAEPAPVDNADHATGALPAAVDTSSGAIEDTHTHAIDPTVGTGARAGDHASASAAWSDSDVPASEEPKTSIKDQEHAAGDDSDAPSGSEPTEAASLDPTPVEASAVAGLPVAPTPAAAQTAVVPVPARATPVVPAAAPAAAVAPLPVTEPLPAPAAAPLPAAVVASVQPAPDAVPSITSTKLDAGTKAAATQAAEPRSTAPLRILVTRRTERDRIVGVQSILADLGYLPPQNFDGTLGRASVVAIKAFQKANGMSETGTFTDALVKKVYEVSGKGEPAVGHLFVRQEFGRVFDAPVNFRDPEQPLGTHMFTAMNFAPGDTTTKWVTISLQGDDPAAALDRLEIPNDVRQKISERLTPGSSLIIGDTAINTVGLPKGADFLVWAKDTPAQITAASADGDVTDQPKKKRNRSVRRYNNYNYSYSTPRSYQQRSYRGYPQWPW